MKAGPQDTILADPRYVLQRNRQRFQRAGSETVRFRLRSLGILSC